MFKTIKKILTTITLAILTICLLSACNSSRNNNNDLEWQPNVYLPTSQYANRCFSVAELFWMRSLFNDFYYWYRDIIDTNPNNFVDNFLNISTYFNYLTTDEITLSGKNKDAFSFLADAALFQLALGDGIEVGYGFRLFIDDSTNPDQVTVAYVAPGSPADTAGITRGDKITTIDGFNFSDINRENARNALFPFTIGETHTFVFNNNTLINLQSAAVTMPPIDNYQVISQSGIDIGYLQFNDHTAASETQLFAAFEDFQTASIDELVLDLRYNSGGRLSIANQVSYMIAGPAKTTALNKKFETLKFNDRFLDEDIFFLDTGLNPNTMTEENLPALNLDRVVIISGPDTCSASESIINGLRGVGVEVILIGDTTCGKPFGFSAFENCGIAYLPILFQGFNDTGFGGYIDGFKPNNKTSDTFAITVDGGCAVADDFTKSLGDNTEARLATALTFINDGITNGSCPPISLITNSVITSGAGTGSKSTLDNHQHPTAFKHRNGLRILE